MSLLESAPRFTKTFIQQMWYRRQVGEANTWERVYGEDEIPLDQQIKAWVESSGAVIVHPGQLGMHQQWHNADMSVKSLTLGLTLLYVEGNLHEYGSTQRSRTTPTSHELPAAVDFYVPAADAAQPADHAGGDSPTTRANDASGSNPTSVEPRGVTSPAAAVATAANGPSSDAAGDGAGIVAAGQRRQPTASAGLPRHITLPARIASRPTVTVAAVAPAAPAAASSPPGTTGDAKPDGV